MGFLPTRDLSNGPAAVLVPWRKRAYITFTADKRKKYPISGRAKLLPRGKQNNIPSGSTISRYGNTRRARHSNFSHATRSDYKRDTNESTTKTDWGFAALKKCYGVTYVIHERIICTVHAHCNWISNRGIVPAPNCVWKTLLSSRVRTSLSTLNVGLISHRSLHNNDLNSETSIQITRHPPFSIRETVVWSLLTLNFEPFSESLSVIGLPPTTL